MSMCMSASAARSSDASSAPVPFASYLSNTRRTCASKPVSLGLEGVGFSRPLPTLALVGDLGTKVRWVSPADWL
eukprot:scaffold203190_cov27-Tisochrysis_lutea.AAC.5